MKVTNDKLRYNHKSAVELLYKFASYFQSARHDLAT